MAKNKTFDLEHQYQLYLQRVGLKEENMHHVQRTETKRAFIGACGQMLILLRDDLSALEESKAIETMQDMMNQVGTYFNKRKMKVELDKKALVDLVNGTSPNYDLFENPLVKLCGTFSGSYGTWSWDKHELEKCSEEQLYDLYKLCRSSWS